ncbi:MAG: hypothetical protein ACLFVK_02805 [Dehalococcoidia bacterium]
MVEPDYEKYLVREPMYETPPGVKNRQSPTMTFMSNTQVPEANYYIEFGWIYGIPEPNPSVHEHVHDYDEIVLHIGGDPDNPEDLGGEIEFYVGGQPLTFNTTSAAFVPAGVRHGPVIWKKFSKPHIEMGIMLGTGSVKEGWGRSGITEAKSGMPEKTDDVDYEKYLVRKPVYEAGPGIKNRQSPSMTLMSSAQVPEANHYIELGWVCDIPEPNPYVHEHVHRYNEILLHFGGDPENPLNLGGEIELYVEGQPLTFNTTSALWVPRGVKHGPLTWKKFEHAHIEMGFMINCGDVMEGWGDSGIHEPKS